MYLQKNLHTLQRVGYYNMSNLRNDLEVSLEGQEIRRLLGLLFLACLHSPCFSFLLHAAIEEKIPVFPSIESYDCFNLNSL